MKNVWRAIIRLCIFVSLFGFCVVATAFGEETLKITQDQFEFRAEPGADDENILGTLRLNTPVIWTGKASGQWLEVRAPNGEVGWVHQSGVTRPQSLPKPTPKPEKTPKAATPKPAGSRSVTPPKPPAKASKAAKTTAQDQALLEEKDRRIAELSKDLDALEGKLADTAQMLDDLDRERQAQIVNVTDT